MASTRKIQDTVNWASLFVGLRPLAGQGGFVGEPALTIANNVLGFILNAPFAWRWNRTKKTFTVNQAAGQSYDQTYTDFGYLESATISDGTTTWPLEIRLSMHDTQDTGRPDHLSAEIDDDAGKITFNLSHIPDKNYTVAINYQRKPVLIDSLEDYWAPIPDELQYLYNSGFLSYVFETIDDGRFPIEYQRFIKSVIAASEGMDDTQKALFLEEKLMQFRQQQDAMLSAQQGRSSRSMS